MVWLLMLKFVIRLALGLVLAMLVIPSREVVSGFFRVHLWVALGLFTFAALLAASRDGHIGLTPVTVAAVLSYLGAVLWLYDRRVVGWWMMVGIVVVAATGLYLLDLSMQSGDRWHRLLSAMNELTSAAALGTTFCAMLLGHWYLNTPTMKLGPLQRLVLCMFAAVFLRALVATGISWSADSAPDSGFAWAMFGLQWLAGIVGTALVALMTWQTLKIPNTQSATGILYVGVIFVFLGEMASLVPGAG